MLAYNSLLNATTWQKGLDSLFNRVSEHYIVDEEVFVSHMINTLDADPEDLRRIADKTAELVRGVRKMDTDVDTIDELLQQYSLDTHEGLKPADRTTCRASPTRSLLPSTSPPWAAMHHCCHLATTRCEELCS